MATLASAVMIINQSTFHPLLIMLPISGLYFSIFLTIVSYGILSLQYVNTMNSIARLSSGFVGGGD